MIRIRTDNLTLSRGRANALDLPATDADGYMPDGTLYVRYAVSWDNTPEGVVYVGIGAVTEDTVTGNHTFAFALPAAFAAPANNNLFVECYWLHPTTLAETAFATLPTRLLPSALHDVYTGMASLTFTVTGQATIAQMAGSHSVVRGTLTGWALVNAAGAPDGADLVITLKRGATAFAETITLPEGDTSAVGTLSAAETENSDTITAWVTQTGVAPDEGGDLTLIVFFIPCRAGGV